MMTYKSFTEAIYVIHIFLMRYIFISQVLPEIVEIKSSYYNYCSSFVLDSCHN